MCTKARACTPRYIRAHKAKQKSEISKVEGDHYARLISIGYRLHIKSPGHKMQESGFDARAHSISLGSKGSPTMVKLKSSF